MPLRTPVVGFGSRVSSPPRKAAPAPQLKATTPGFAWAVYFEHEEKEVTDWPTLYSTEEKAKARRDAIAVTCSVGVGRRWKVKCVPIY